MAKKINIDFICLMAQVKLAVQNWWFKIIEQETKLTSTAGVSASKIFVSDVCNQPVFTIFQGFCKMSADP